MNESLKTWAKRMGVSVPMLQRLEAGDPSLVIGYQFRANKDLDQSAFFGCFADAEPDGRTAKRPPI